MTASGISPLTLRGSISAITPGRCRCPGGRLDAGESVETAALREAHEEMGVSPPTSTCSGGSRRCRLPSAATCCTRWWAPPRVGRRSASRAHEVEALIEIPLARLRQPDVVQWDVRERSRPPLGLMDVPYFDLGGGARLGRHRDGARRVPRRARVARADLTHAQRVAYPRATMTRIRPTPIDAARRVATGRCGAALDGLPARCTTAEAPGVSSGPPAGSIPQRTKEQNVELGRQHKTAWDLYQALKAEAKGGQTLDRRRRCPTGAGSTRGRPTRASPSIPTCRRACSPPRS